jgi:hypothetical protein
LKTDEKSPTGGKATLLEMRHLLNMCDVRSADGSDLGRSVPLAIGLEMEDGDTPIFLVRKDFLISSLKAFKPRRQVKVGQRSCARRNR